MAAVKHKDGDGHHWLVPANQTIPRVDVWWNRSDATFRGKRIQSEFLVVRQERDDAEVADVVCLNLGQVYDLIDALNQAVENT